MINKIANALPQERRFQMKLHTVLAVALGTLLVFASLWMAFHAPLAVGKIGWALSGTMLCGALLLSLVNLKYLIKNYKQDKTYQLLAAFQQSTQQEVNAYMEKIIAAALRNDPESIDQIIKLLDTLRAFIAMNHSKVPQERNPLDIMGSFLKQLFEFHNFDQQTLIKKDKETSKDKEISNPNPEYDLEKSKAAMFIWLSYPRSNRFLSSEFIFNTYQKCSKQEQELFCRRLIESYTQRFELLSTFPNLNEDGCKLLMSEYLFDIGYPKFSPNEICLDRDFDEIEEMLDQFEPWKEDAVFKELHVEEFLIEFKQKIDNYKALFPEISPPEIND